MNANEIYELKMPDEQFQAVLNNTSVDTLVEVKDLCENTVSECKEKLEEASQKFQKHGIQTNEKWYEACDSAMKIRQKHLGFINDCLQDQLV
jgi:hypothetical protein